MNIDRYKWPREREVDDSDDPGFTVDTFTALGN
jgi:hypothetical protein